VKCCGLDDGGHHAHISSIVAGGKQGKDQLEKVQYHPLSGAESQQSLRKLQDKSKGITRRHSYTGRSTPLEDILGTAPKFPKVRRPKNAGNH